MIVLLTVQPVRILAEELPPEVTALLDGAKANRAGRGLLTIYRNIGELKLLLHNLLDRKSVV